MRWGRSGSRWAAALAMAAAASAVAAAPVRIFKTQSAEALLRGEASNVAVESGGVLALAPGAERVAALEAPFAFAAAPFEGGWAVATGNDGQLVAVGADGSPRVLFDADESELFALAAERDGSLLAGSSPDGKVYRVARDGSSSVLFDPEGTYIWSLTRDAAGALWVATGDPGRLYRIRAGGGEPETVWDGGATHVRSVLALPGGDVLFGTAGDGRLLRWRDGVVRTLHDSALTEVVALAPGAGGAIWMALLSSEASFVDLAPRSMPAGDDGGAAVVVVEEGAAGSRPAGARGPRSELWRLLPSGVFERAWSSADETIFTLLAEGDRLWAGTGLSGRVYRFEQDRARVEREFEAKQVVALLAAADGPVALTTNGAELWRFTARREPSGSYTSSPLDALQVARFGVFRWSGDAPPGSSVRVAFRTGFASEPDATWSDWTAPREGNEIALDDLDAGRYVQYRLELAAAAGKSPRVISTELSYRQQNVRPSVDSVGVLDPGQILVPAGFNPAEQLFEPASPNRQGIFDTLKPAAPREERLKGVFRVGWRTLRWEAQDPNGDELRFQVSVRPEGAPDAWLEIVADHDASFFAFDTASLPDGFYRFRVTASDARGNPAPGEALEAAGESEAVLVDRTPPALGRVRRTGKRLTAEVYDAASPLRDAELSIDGGAWKPLRVADGMLDGRREELVVDDLAPDARLLLLRVSDAAFNVRTFDLGAEAAR